MTRSQGLFVATKLCGCKPDRIEAIQIVGAGVSLISINIENKQTNLYLVMCHVIRTGFHLSQMKCQILSNPTDLLSS